MHVDTKQVNEIVRRVELGEAADAAIGTDKEVKLEDDEEEEDKTIN